MALTICKWFPMIRLRSILLLLFSATMFWCFIWITSPLIAGQYGRSSGTDHERKNLIGDSSHNIHNSTSNSDWPYKCASTEKLASAQVLERRLPKCLIIGFSKCGTYTLKSFLTLHPDIVSPNLEISFFTKFYHKGLDWYRQQMPMSAGSTITVEKTPNYIMSMNALSRIRDFNASIKLIVIVRDPVTRLQSSYAHVQASVKLFNETFESWLTKNGTIDRVANYEKHIQNVFRLFNSRQVLLLQEELLERDPLSVLRNVEPFLGLCHAFTDDLLVFDSGKGFYCFNQSSPKYGDVVQTLSLDHTNGCFPSSKGRLHPTIGQRLLKQLLLKLSPYNEKLFALIGERFNWTRLE